VLRAGTVLSILTKEAIYTVDMSTWQYFIRCQRYAFLVLFMTTSRFLCVHGTSEQISILTPACASLIKSYEATGVLVHVCLHSSLFRFSPLITSLVLGLEWSIIGLYYENIPTLGKLQARYRHTVQVYNYVDKIGMMTDEEL